MNMWPFSAWRHHLQNDANRRRISADRRQRADAATATRTARAHDIEMGRSIRDREEKTKTQTQAEYVQELHDQAERLNARARGTDADVFRKAAAVAERMNADEWEHHRQAMLRHDGTGGARVLAARF